MNISWRGLLIDVFVLLPLGFLAYNSAASNIIRVFILLIGAAIGLLLLFWTQMRRPAPISPKDPEIQSGEIILAVSDVHLGYNESYEKSDSDAFTKFLKRLTKPLPQNVDNDSKPIQCDRLVICGDFLDLWRRDQSSVLSESKEVLESLHELQSRGIKLHCVVGNHDYSLRHSPLVLSQLNAENSANPGHSSSKNSVRFHKGLKLKDRDQEYIFLHGDEFDIFQFESLYDLFCMSDNFTGAQMENIWRFWKFIRKESKGILNKLKTAPIAIWWAIKTIPSWNPVKWFAKEKPKKELRKKVANPATLRFSHEKLHEKLNLTEMGKKSHPKLPGNYVEQKAFKYAKKRKNRFLIFGHTHVPFVWQDEKEKVHLSNPGSWVVKNNEASKEPTYLKIRNGRMELYLARGLENRLISLEYRSEAPKTKQVEVQAKQ